MSHYVSHRPLYSVSFRVINAFEPIIAPKSSIPKVCPCALPINESINCIQARNYSAKIGHKSVMCVRMEISLLCGVRFSCESAVGVCVTLWMS